MITHRKPNFLKAAKRLKENYSFPLLMLMLYCIKVQNYTSSWLYCITLQHYKVNGTINWTLSEIKSKLHVYKNLQKMRLNSNLMSFLYKINPNN